MVSKIMQPSISTILALSNALILPEPTTPLANPASDDFSPLSFFGCTLGAVSVAGLIALELKSKDNITTVSDIVHTVNAVLNVGRSPSNKP